MSATIGTFAARTISFIAAVESAVGQDTRMMSAPASSQRRIWSIVAAASSVCVLVMVWTLIGASPPTGTEPTMICRDLRRSISRQGRMEDIDDLGGAYRRSRLGGKAACTHTQSQSRLLWRCVNSGTDSLGAANEQACPIAHCRP